MIKKIKELKGIEIKEDIDLICNGNLMYNEDSIEEIISKYWHFNDILTLFYRKKSDYNINNNFGRNSQSPKISKLRQWIPDSVAYNCMNRNCNKEFGFWNRIHHCRLCRLFYK